MDFWMKKLFLKKTLLALFYLKSSYLISYKRKEPPMYLKLRILSVYSFLFYVVEKIANSFYHKRYTISKMRKVMVSLRILNVIIVKKLVDFPAPWESWSASITNFISRWGKCEETSWFPCPLGDLECLYNQLSSSAL